MMKAAEDLKQQQLLKEQERQRILSERIIPLPDVDSMNDVGQLQKIAQEMWKRVGEVEDSKYDLEYQVRQKDFEINELTIAVNDLRGKFVKPTLKKVSKYDSKMNKMAAQAGAKKADLRGGLKVIKKDPFNLDELLGIKDGQEPAAAAPAAAAAEPEAAAEE